MQCGRASWYRVDFRVTHSSVIKPTGCASEWLMEAVTGVLASCSSSWRAPIAGLCMLQNDDFMSGVLGHPVLTFPGSPLYSAYRAFVAAHTSLWFFMLPSTTKARPQPVFSQWCSVYAKKNEI